MERQTYSEAGTAPRETLRFLAAPTDVNWGGKVHGGIVMRWIDEAAHVMVTRWTHDPRNVAIFTGGVRFYRPLRIGDLVEVFESRCQDVVARYGGRIIKSLGDSVLFVNDDPIAAYDTAEGVINVIGRDKRLPNCHLRTGQIGE